MKFTKLFWSAIAAISMAVALMAPSGALAASDGDPGVITISGAGPQGRWFKEASLFGKVLTENLSDLSINGVIGKGVSVGNIKRVAAGKVQAGRFFLFDMENALKNQAQFEKGDYKNVRVWMKLGTHLFRVVAEKGIDTFSDLKGRTIAVGVKGSGDDLLATRVLAGYGIDPSNTKFRYVGRKDGQAALANGQIDAIAFAYTRNNQGHLGPIFAARKIGVDVDFVKPDEDKTAEFLASDATFFLDTLGEPAFGRPDLKGIAFFNGMAIDANLSEDIVYRMTKALFENWDDVLLGAPWWAEPGEASLEDAARITTAPYHPGAVKYFKEKGVWDKFQKN